MNHPVFHSESLAMPALLVKGLLLLDNGIECVKPFSEFGLDLLGR